MSEENDSEESLSVDPEAPLQTDANTPKKWPHRPTKLTPTFADKIIRSLEGGASIRLARERAGLHKTTWDKWKQRAKLGEEPYASFFGRVDVALTVPLDRIEEAVMKGGVHNHDIGLRILRVRRAKKWGETKKVELAGEVGVRGLAEFLSLAFPDAGKDEK